MTTVSLPRRNRSALNQRIRFSGACLFITISVLVMVSLLSTLFLESSEADDYGNEMPMSDGNKELSQTSLSRRQTSRVATNSIGKSEEEFTVWNVSAQDGLDMLDDYGTSALTGSHIFVDSPACAKARASSSAQIGCMVHFPWIDMKNAIDHDECLKVAAIFQGLRAGAQYQEVQHKPLPPPRQTNHLLRQPVASMKNQHALLTRCGCKSQTSGVSSNQDRAVLVKPFLVNDASQPNDFVMGVFDGHGMAGHVVSNFAVLELPRVLSNWLTTQAESMGHDTATHENEEFRKKALTETFLEIDRTLPVVPTAGSTASVILRLGPALYVANAGDSHSMIVAYDTDKDIAKIVYKNQLHKPHLIQERQRIEGMGGQVIMPQSQLDSSRVMVPIGHSGDYMALAMSRSIGDREAKPAGVIADPAIDVLRIESMLERANLSKNNVHLFAVAASDGLLDKVPIDQVALHLGRSLYRQDTLPPLQACEQLVMKSSELWIAQGMPYRDDITIAVTKVLL